MAELSDEEMGMLTACAETARRIWADEDYKHLALSEPRQALAENGWEVPGEIDVRIELIRPDDVPADLDVEAILAGLRQGIDRGDLVIPITAEPPTAEPTNLTDEDLAGVAGAACQMWLNRPPA